MTQLPPVIVISLKKSEDRRKVIGARLDALGLQYSFFEGINGHALDRDRVSHYDGTRRLLFFGKHLTPGEIGCLSSHRAVYQKIVDENIPCALVLEDDAQLSDDLPAVLESLMDMQKSWDAIRFLARDKVYKSSRFIRALNGPYELTRPFGTPGGAYGTLVSQKAAQALVRAMEKNYIPNDTTLGQVWRTGLDVYAVRPSPITPDMVVESTIGDKRFEETVDLQGWMKPAFKLTRPLYKIYDALGKYYVWLSRR
jgi:glycosyl transferase, family 25